MPKDEKTIAVIAFILLIFYSISPVLAFDNQNNLTGIGQEINNSLISITSAYEANAKPIPQTINNKSDGELAIEKINNLMSVNTSSTNSSDTNTSDNLTYPATDQNQDNWNLGDTLSTAVTNGIINALNKLGDEGFKLGMNDSNAEQLKISENHGLVVAIIYTIATIDWDPFSVAFIQEMQYRTAIIGFFMLIMFIILGAMNVNICAMTTSSQFRNQFLLSNRHSSPIVEYCVTIIEALLMVLFGYTILRLTLLFESVLSQLVMIPILDRIAPTGDNTLLYLGFISLYICMGIVLGIRFLIIGIYAGSFIFFVGLYLFGYTRPIAVKAFLYFLKIVFLRFAIILITTMGVGIITSIQLDPNLPATVNIGIGLIKLYLVPLMMLGLLIILLAISVTILLDIRGVVGTAKRIAYKAAVGY